MDKAFAEIMIIAMKIIFILCKLRKTENTMFLNCNNKNGLRLTN